ncbi:MAG: chromate resistance protein ChrB domain-containing protein [Acetobacteraceae bacterium]
MVETTDDQVRWLLLIHQLPAKPAYQRVKTWRRLQSLGAVAIKNAVHALPANEQAQEDFEWLLREIRDGGGEALICEARLVDGLSDAEVQAMFNATRGADYDALAQEARNLSEALDRPDIRPRLARLKASVVQTVAIDFFGANGRETVDGLIAGLEARLDEEDATGKARADVTPGVTGLGSLTNRVWVTRQGVYVDRIASAWLIRRFIDPDARFRFVRAKGHVPQDGELRFDMFEAEFTHEGDRCTFEVLLARLDLNDTALTAIAEIVHDIDLKDTRYGRAETDGIAHLITGLCLTNKDDAQRLVRGAAVLDDLYEYFRKRRG